MTAEEKKGFPLRAPKSLLEYLQTEAQQTGKSANEHITEILAGYVAFRKAESEPKK